MNKLEAHRAEKTALRIQFGLPDPRKAKRYENAHQTPVYLAWVQGQYDVEQGLYHNSYPAGWRYNEYERGWKLACEAITPGYTEVHHA